MFHVIAPGTHIHVFTTVNPAEDGFTLGVDRDFALDHAEERLGVRECEEYPMRCLGWTTDNPRFLRAFRSPDACRQAGYTFLSYDWYVCERWSDYLKKQ